MSQFQPDAINFLLNNEDPRHEYASVPDVGGRAISGINSASYPEDYADIASIPQDSRGPAVADFYKRCFWNPLQAGGIESQDVANRLLDQAVNGGLNTGAIMLQRAANDCGCKLTADGHIGPMTLEAVNALDSDRLVTAFRARRAAHYEAIVAENPARSIYLDQWLARARQ